MKTADVTAATSPAPHSLKLKPNAKPRVLAGHPWVFANEVENLLPPEHDGSVVECRDRQGRFLGTGIYNSKSQIVWRRLSRERIELDAAYLRAAIERAIARRASVGKRPDVRAETPCRRLVWSESDDLPGVVVDQFGGTLVLQVQTLAMEQRSTLISDSLDALLSPDEIIFRNDAPIRRLEGLPLEVRTRSGRPWEPRWVKVDGLDYWLDLQGGQKTGFYLDQRAQHGRVAAYCAGKRVLDAFCNQGAFALHAARAGASKVLGLDSAEDAVAAARRNATQNRLNAEFGVANVFDWFNAPGRAAEPLWDVIILDPPPFAKSKSALEGALRGYKEINLRAMQRLAPGGVLATYTCSHHMHDAELRGVLAEAATDAKRKVRVLEHCHQPADHPVLVTMPESEYLRGYILSVE
ncbi:class I SAM-dependent rRNA methyltransferase [Opitutus terrae]|uniref:Putative SAM-dependent methyltransferase n=1 Tax=Opitutus terrae (strain DSM 11246 / JCM 15787 / PB90-1) TaxID=452637 RepID=B1ZV13_OPITP|nr:class I SAM-dependent rRNA methyltransferase [Opitutus terrae]ACB75983.1 putative SAM-dependent methyltransferase [Opitutus terrae PB90-1]